MEEPSVLDYLKAKLSPWRRQKIEIPSAEAPVLETPPAPNGAISSEMATPAATAVHSREIAAVPWRSLAAVVLGVIGQVSLQPGPDRSWQPGAILYLLGAVCLAWA